MHLQVKHPKDKLSSSDADTLLTEVVSVAQGSIDYQGIISNFYST